MRKALRKVAATLAACTMAFALAASMVPDTADASVECSKAGEKAGKAEIDQDGTYHAYFLFQQKDSWVFRNEWYHPALGKDGTDYVEDASYDNMLTTLNLDHAVIVDGTVTDVEIKGNGTYKVGVTGLDVSKLDQDASKIVMCGFSTDIPSKAIEDGTITISDVKLDIDGITKVEGQDPFFNLDAKEWGLAQFDVVNLYQNEGYESPSMMIPNDSIEITFTVSGFNSDNPDAVASAGDDTTTGDSANETSSGSTASNASSEGGSSTTAIVVVVIVVIIIAVVAVVVVKKKKN